MGAIRLVALVGIGLYLINARQRRSDSAMSLHRLDLCTLTAETAWEAFAKHRQTNRLASTLALRKHFERIDERMAAKCCVAESRPGDVFGLHPKREMLARNSLDHTARGRVR
jgi:hypothetical protein